MSKGAENKAYEALYGTVVSGRYKLVKFCDQLEKTSDREIGWLFQGVDMQNSCEIGVRVVQTPDDHRRLHAWLAQALLSPAREAILAVGHLDRKRTYVVFSGAVLNHWKPPPDVEDELDESAEDSAEGESIYARAKAEQAARTREKAGAIVFRRLRKLLEQPKSSKETESLDETRSSDEHKSSDD